MNKLTDILSQKSWAVLLLGFYVCLAVIFQPSPWEFGVYFLVDFAALMLLVAIDTKFFFRMNPALRFLNDTRYLELSSLDPGEKKLFYHDLAAFPQRRSRFAFWISYVVNIPGTLIVLFYWSYACSFEEQALKWLLLVHINFAYLYVMCLIELHQFISEKIQDIHAQQDWTEIFSEITPPAFGVNVHKISALGEISIFVLLFVGQWFFIAAYPGQIGGHALQFFCLGSCCVMLILRIRYSERNLLLHGIERVFLQFSQVDRDKTRSLALHTLPQIANFDCTFNSLLLRLRQKEHEIGMWIIKELNENRFKVMGEISGLVLHDLASPFQVVSFCVQEVVQHNSQLLKDPKFCEHLLKNIEHSKTLLHSYDRFLRNPKDNAGVVTTISTAHMQAKEIVNSQFYHYPLLQNLSYRLDAELAEVEIAIGSADLLHIFYNLYKNSVEYFIREQWEQATIEISARQLTKEQVIFEVSDSGPGLSSAIFRDMVSSPILLKNQDVFGKSLGLRLVESLIRHHQGSLCIHQLTEDKTCFRVSLPIKVSVEKRGISGWYARDPSSLHSSGHDAGAFAPAST